MTLSAIKSELQKATTIARQNNQTLYRLWRNYS
jgi:hypothetical protein